MINMMDMPTETEENSGNHNENHKIQIKSQLPSTIVVNKLEDEYKNLTDLMMKLDVEIGSFTGHMGQIHNNVSSFVGLTELWLEQVKTIDQEMNEFQLVDADPDKVITEKKK